MRARVEDACSGCGLCADICPEVFKMQVIYEKSRFSDFFALDPNSLDVTERNNQYAEAIVDKVPAEHEDDVQQAADECPVEAIVVE